MAIIYAALKISKFTCSASIEALEMQFAATEAFIRNSKDYFLREYGVFGNKTQFALDLTIAGAKNPEVQIDSYRTKGFNVLYARKWPDISVEFIMQISREADALASYLYGYAGRINSADSMYSNFMNEVMGW